MGYFRFFFTHSRIFTALYPTLCVKKKNYKRILQITSYEKSKKIDGDSVKNESARAKKLEGGGAKRPPPQPVYS